MLLNSDYEILAKYQTLSLELNNFSFSVSNSTSPGCAVGSIIANNLSILNKIECVDLCSKDVDFAVKIFENENEKSGFYTRKNTKPMNR